MLVYLHVYQPFSIKYHTLTQETQRLMAEPVQGIRAVPDENNARYFHVVVAGPGDVS